MIHIETQTFLPFYKTLASRDVLIAEMLRQVIYPEIDRIWEIESQEATDEAS